MITREFTAQINDKDVNFIVRSPSINDQKEASKVYNQTFSDAIKAKAIIRAKIDELLKEQGLWDDDKQDKFTDLQSQILERERKLAKGGIPLSQAKSIALEMRDLRAKVRELIGVKTNLDNLTAEGQADNARFNYLVSACTVYKDNNQPYFSSMEDYLTRSTDIVAIKGAQTLANMIYGLDNDYESNLPENKFLKQFKFIDSKLRLINKEGKLVDEEGRLVDEFGRFIDSDGKYVDKFGNRIDEDGKYIVETQPFLDDDGNPIIQESAKDEKTVSASEPQAIPEVKEESKTQE
jgi:hypothetical protein